MNRILLLLVVALQFQIWSCKKSTDSSSLREESSVEPLLGEKFGEQQLVIEMPPLGNRDFKVYTKKSGAVLDQISIPYSAFEDPLNTGSLSIFFMREELRQMGVSDTVLQQFLGDQKNLKKLLQIRKARKTTGINKVSKRDVVPKNGLKLQQGNFPGARDENRSNDDTEKKDEIILRETPEDLKQYALIFQRSVDKSHRVLDFVRRVNSRKGLYNKIAFDHRCERLDVGKATSKTMSSFCKYLQSQLKSTSN